MDERPRERGQPHQSSADQGEDQPPQSQTADEDQALDLMTVGQAARLLGMSPSFVRKIPDSELPAWRVGSNRHRRYKRADVIKYRDRLSGDNK